MNEQRMLANDAFQKKLISTSFGMRCRRKGLQSLKVNRRAADRVPSTPFLHEVERPNVINGEFVHL